MVIPSHGRKGVVSRPQESGAVIPVYKGKVNTGLSVGCKVGRLRRAKKPLKTETTAPPPTTDRKGKIIRWGYTGKQAAGRTTTERPPTRRRVFTKKIP